ncbi:hypothetical protein NQ314_009225 [Rhamnusium bicolor]|uniref:Uncharacterized protein n=1 Tax=Rhamnusium bicolor TaxID=1586634 RepID=A0AAV8Y2N3_9CUCU|nr:hypothetical protein NQ314_009225 [Rhamnusium bicolor]
MDLSEYFFEKIVVPKISIIFTTLYVFLSYSITFNRLPEENFQTSKIAKLLLMIEKGINKEDEGKTLDEIDIQLTAMESNEIVAMNTETGKSILYCMSKLKYYYHYIT